MYAESTERMTAIKKEHNDGKVSAFAVQAGKAQQEGNARGCWKCGGTDHMKKDCPNSDAIRAHKCAKCGKQGHLEKFCREDGSEGRQQDKSKKSPKAVQRSDWGKGAKGSKAVSNKTIRRQKVIQEAVARLMTLGQEDEEEEAQDEELEQGEDEEAEEDDVFFNGCTVCEIEDVVVEAQSNDGVQALLLKPRKFIIDSGCRGAHVVASGDIVEKTIDTSRWKKMPVVRGISGHQIRTTDIGTIPGLQGMALVTPAAEESLLSLMEMVKHNNGSFSGDSKTLTVKDGGGDTVLVATNDGDDFWSCKESDLVKQPVHGLITTASSTFHLTAEERMRALEAYELCAVLRHPGDAAVIAALDNGCLGANHLTGQDFRNGRRLRGACIACEEAKMKAPAEPTSQHEPARAIGEHLHADLIPLKNRSLGGNVGIFVAVDEKSSFLVGVPIKSKSASNIQEAAEAMLVEFNRYGHRVQRFTTDDERTLATLRDPLGKLGIQVTTTPAGLHEKRIERHIQTIKDRRRAMLAGLSYELPAILECESYMDAITWINRLPNFQLGTTTPYQLVTGQKSFLPRYYFGQVGLFHSPSKDVDLRSEWGIFIGYGPTPNYLRAYLPLKKHMYSKRRFSPQAHIPSELGLLPRLRVVSPPVPLPSPVSTPPGNATFKPARFPVPLCHPPLL